MTIVVSGSSIKINNASGIEKFNSNNKLVYQRFYQKAQTTISPGGRMIPIFTVLGTNEFLVLTIKITSSSGQADLNAALINREIPVTGPILIDFFGRNVDNQAAVDSEVLGIDCIADYLFFRPYRRTNTGDITPGQVTLTLEYTARIWSFL
jgi:hypothetical protein